MKTVSNDFKNELKTNGRELTNYINIYTDYLLTTENDKNILTQNDIQLLAKTQNKTLSTQINDEHIFNINVIQKGYLLSTMMKELDFESDVDLKVGMICNYIFGLKVNGDYETLDYGEFIIYKKEFNEDAKHWNYVCYDYMLKTMISIDDRSIIENTLISNAINNIAIKCNLIVNIDEDTLNEFPNLSQTIQTDTFKDMDMTYRDVLEQICQAVGFSIYDDNGELKFKSISQTEVDTIDKTYLKDINVTFKEKYGPINSLVLSRSEDNDNIYSKDDESIEQNGLHEFKIKDNLIMNNQDRDDFIDNIFEQLNGVEFYINDFQSIGICYLDWLDTYNIDIDNNIYKCLMLNDEIKIKNGLSENIYTEQPEETVTDYKTSSKSDKEVSFIVDKQKSEIIAKVSKGDVINQINLDESGLSIEASKININGVISANNNFKVLTDGSMEAVNGKFSGEINGGAINVSGYSQNHPYIKVGDFSSDRYPYGVMIFDNGISAIDYRDSGYVGAVIRTEYDGGYAELNGDSIYCSGEVSSVYGVCQGSLEKLKKDFKKFNNGLDIINNTEIYKYKYKNQDTDKDHIGFVIGDNYKYSKEITNEDNTSVDLYSFTSVCCKAIQEQQEQIDELKNEIELLKRSDK